MRPDRQPQVRAVIAAAGERLGAVRYLLAAAVAALGLAAAFGDVPAGFAVLAALLLIAIAAVAPGPAHVPLRPPTSASDKETPDRAAAAVLDAVPRASFLLDETGLVRFANRRAAELFPATRSGDPFDLTFRWPELVEPMREAQAGRASTAEFRVPGDARVAYTVSFVPFEADDGTRGQLVSLDDVSDRLAIARMRSDFVANASHELRTPLASLTGFLETLLGPARNDPDATAKFLGIMLDQARRMRRLIDDLLVLSRAEMRVHTRPTERVDLAAVVRQAADALAPLAEEHGVALATAVPGEGVFVRGDHDELLQVFQNLIENAIRYGGSGERVEIGMERQPGARPTVAVHVRDYGPGIAPEHIPRLTERFYRVDVGASREKKGTGLGLAIVKHILTRHQGTLEIHSRPGEGARFTVELPEGPAA